MSRKDIHNKRYNLKTLYHKTDGMCYICGRYIDYEDIHTNKVGVDHFIPLAVVKWVNSKLKSVLLSYDNTFLVHYGCNMTKGDTYTNVLNTKLDHISKYKLLSFIKDNKLEDEVKKYEQLKKRLLKKQNYSCYCCHRHITLNNSAIRRLDDKSNRVEDNAVMICSSCVGSWHYARRKFIH